MTIRLNPELRDCLQRQELVLVPNRRLSLALRNQFAAESLAAGCPVCPEPRLKSFDGWLDGCWSELVQCGDREALSLRVLSRAHELALWQQVILADDSFTGGSARAAVLGEQAASAFRLMHDWLPEELPEQWLREFEFEADCRAFSRWRQHFDRRCSAAGWLPAAARLSRVLAALHGGILKPEPRIVLFACGDLAPRQHAVLQAAAEQLLQLSPNTEAVPAQLYVADDKADELRSAAGWARQAAEDDPDCSIAIVVPDLHRRRVVVDRVLRELFTPAGILPQTPGDEGPYSISAPPPLLGVPLVQAAMKLLQLCIFGLPPQQLRPLLHSPFVVWSGSGQRKFARLAALLLCWRGRRIELRQILELAQQSQLDELAVQLSGIEVARRQQSSDRWAVSFADCLKQLGWPGRRRLDSAEFQQYRHWQAVMEELASGAEVYGAMNAAQALDALQRLLRLTPFQPEVRRAQVQVLGVLEAAGQRFDRLWFTGVGEYEWPPLVEPNPFLPFQLQRHFELPGAERDRDLAFYTRLSGELLAAATQQTVLSYARQGEDWEEGGLSRLLGEGRDFAQFESVGEDPYRGWYRRLSASGVLEPLAIAGVAESEVERLRGSVQLLSDQARCPFRAFARHRLKAGDLPDYVGPGLERMQRGNLVHQVLQYIWEQLGGSETLLGMADTEALQQSVAAAVRRGVDEQRRSWREEGGAEAEQLWQLETQRLEELVLGLMRLELAELGSDASAIHFTAFGIERRLEFPLGGLQFSLRVDRMDRFADGRLRLIDYKTGRGDRLAFRLWKGDRPEEPQLPLYALGAAEKGWPVAGLGWIVADLAAISAEPSGSRRAFRLTDEPPEAAGWDAELRSWNEVLTALVSEYRNGFIDIHSRRARACDGCEYKPLCRVDSLDAVPTAVAEAGGET